MIILTERLQEMADNIEKGELVADIGTDHGYLPLYLYEKGISPKVILTDVSKGSLDKARENAKRLFPGLDFDEHGKSTETPVDLRLGDGLEVLENGEVDAVIIAGIGGLLMTEIMDWDISKTLSFKKYILQPRNNAGALRKYLDRAGFIIDKLIIVPEDRRYCEIMVVRPGDAEQNIERDSYDNAISELQIAFEFGAEENKSTDTGRQNIDLQLDPDLDLTYELPDILVEQAGPYTKSYLEEQLKLEQRIVNNIAAGHGVDAAELTDDPDVASRTARITRIQTLLNKLSM